MNEKQEDNMNGVDKEQQALDRISSANFANDDMDFGGGGDDEEEVKGFSGGGMVMTGKVSIDHASGQVTGWDTIWGLIKEENETKSFKDDNQAALKNKLQDGVNKYIDSTQSNSGNFDTEIDANLLDFSEFEVEAVTGS